MYHSNPIDRQSDEDTPEQVADAAIAALAIAASILYTGPPIVPITALVAVQDDPVRALHAPAASQTAQQIA